MRVLGIAADGSRAVMETDGRTIDAVEEVSDLIDLIGLAIEDDAQAVADRHGVPVACGFGANPALWAVYFRARVRTSDLERPTAVVDGDQVILVEENGLLISGADVGQARSVIRVEELGPLWQAEAVAYLAARCWNGFPIAFPGTTGAPYPMTAGRIVRPQ